ncbi:hypothetical protein BLNAU_22594 [Blattamonas nauphoetae]|uniref:Uncharacterized protein n=1 Tax=Blattamonas nauphoetae TaxID=2049346 RepID=A0ABQ9WT28_9EUKA|nr:hypothetical protein BLNAU_22594 [Blattamonas nauphoetae]
MKEEAITLHPTTGTYSSDSRDSHTIVKPEEEPFLHFDPNSKLSFEDKSRIYNSLVALVKAEYPFDITLKRKAIRFLKSLEPKWDEQALATKLVTDLVPSSAGSTSGFVTSIVTLLSSPHSTVIKATLSFLNQTTNSMNLEIRCRLVESDVITNILSTVQPHTRQISGNETILNIPITLIDRFVDLTGPWPLRSLGITDAVDKYTHREMIFQKVLLPSSPFVTFLITNRYILKGDMLGFFMSVLCTLIDICPFHGPTLEFVLASPIALSFSSCHSIVEEYQSIYKCLYTIRISLDKWKEEGPEVAQSGKRMMQALFSEGFEDTLQQMLKYNMDGIRGLYVIYYSCVISKILGANLTKPEL